ncbi:helix-turn-helix domain-containing protein [uncultured Pseudacidovorax sp.]|uniref:helix-turn-helix domain-containing protein n=2 Tax=uncultured Pseudacidovorax sp. TaxID=679313 RepID=UPI00345C72CA
MPSSEPVCVPKRLLARVRAPKRGVDGSMELRIGMHVRAHRERLGMSISALARVSGLSLSMLSRVERGLVSPSTQTLGRIAGALDVRIGALFEEGLSKAEATSEASSCL